MHGSNNNLVLYFLLTIPSTRSRYLNTMLRLENTDHITHEESKDFFPSCIYPVIDYF